MRISAIYSSRAWSSWKDWRKFISSRNVLFSATGRKSQVVTDVADDLCKTKSTHYLLSYLLFRYIQGVQDEKIEISTAHFFLSPLFRSVVISFGVMRHWGKAQRLAWEIIGLRSADEFLSLPLLLFFLVVVYCHFSRAKDWSDVGVHEIFLF